MRTLNNASQLGVENGIATLITTYLIKKFKMDNMHYGIIFSLVLGSIVYFKNDFKPFDILPKLNNIELNWLPYILLSIVGIYGMYYIWKNYINKWWNSQYMIINVYTNAGISNISKYLKYFPNNVDKNYQLMYGDPDLICDYANGATRVTSSDRNKKIIKPGTVMKIEDKELGFKGKIYWKIFKKGNEIEKKELDGTITKTKKEHVIYFPTLIIKVTNNKIKCTSDFMDILIEKINKIESNRTILLHYKILKKDKTNNIVDFYLETIYDGPKINRIVRENLYINTFFHTERDRLWYLIKAIHYNPQSIIELGQSPRLNLLLYGPPGTGKSSFAYRIGRALNRHIFSIDLRDIESKKDMIKLLRQPNVNFRSYYPKNIVYILDEFDLGIKYLMKKQHVIDIRTKNAEKQINYKSDLMGKILDKFDDIDIDKDIGSMAATVKEKNEEKKDDKKKDKKKDDDSDDNFMFGMNPLAQLMHRMQKGPNYSALKVDPDVFVLKDLLDVFQGPVPREGTLIFATTNDFDEIYKMCPALFRPGRMTPVFFGYANIETIQEISEFYFKKRLNIYIPEQHHIPTSQIIELALEAINYEKLGNLDDKFDYFEASLDKLF